MGLNKISHDRLAAAERGPDRPALRGRPISFVWRPRMLLVCLIAPALIVFLSALSIGLGDYPFSVPRVLEVSPPRGRNPRGKARGSRLAHALCGYRHRGRQYFGALWRANSDSHPQRAGQPGYP